MAGVRFTRESAVRIAKGIRNVEAQQSTSVAGQRGRSNSTPWDQILIGKTDAAHNKSASGTISIWDGTSSSGLADSGENITAYNRFGNIQTGKFVAVFTFPWGYEIIAAEC